MRTTRFWDIVTTTIHGGRSRIALVIGALLAIGTGHSSAEGLPFTVEWTAVPQLSAGGVRPSSSFGPMFGRVLPDGRLVYEAGATNGISRLLLFDPKANAWAWKAAMPPSALTLETLSDGRVFVMCGAGMGGSIYTPYIYDPGTDTFSKKTAVTNSNPNGVSFMPKHIVELSNGEIYCHGNGNSLITITAGFIYNRISNTWRAGPGYVGTSLGPELDLPSGRWACDASVSIFNSSTIAWRTVTPPAGFQSIYRACLVDGVVYAETYGGADATKIWTHDLNTDAFSEIAQMNNTDIYANGLFSVSIGGQDWLFHAYTKPSGDANFGLFNLRVRDPNSGAWINLSQGPVKIVSNYADYRYYTPLSDGFLMMGCGTNKVIKGQRLRVIYNGSTPPPPSVDPASLPATLTLDEDNSQVVSYKLLGDIPPAGVDVVVERVSGDSDVVVMDGALQRVLSRSDVKTVRIAPLVDPDSLNDQAVIRVRVVQPGGGADPNARTMAVTVRDLYHDTGTVTNHSPVITEGASVAVPMSEDGAPTAFNLTLHATDADADTLTWSISSLPLNGVATASGTGASKAISYVPSANYNGADSFAVKVSDGNGGTDTINVNVTIQAVNDAPTCVMTAPANGATFLAPAAITLQATASDVDGSITKVEFFKGTTRLATDTTSPYTYAWKNVAAGTYTLTAKATDNNSVTTTSASVSITVTAVGNQTPTANAQSVSTAEDTAKAITLAGSDPEGAALTYSIFANPAHGTLTGTGASRTYTPAANYNGADSFTFKVSDGALTSTPATVSITVTAVNDAPTCALTAPANGATYTAPASIAIQATASDVDGTIAKVEFFNGATKLGQDTTSPYAYTWSGVAAGSYTLTVKATDNNSVTTTSATVSITVTSTANQPPTANVQSVSTAEDTAKAITLTGSDPEGSALTYIVANPAHGTLTGTGASRTYTPAANYNGADSFTFKVSDGALTSTPATVSITVTAVNDLPTVTASGTPTSGTAPLTVAFSATGADVDGDALSYAWDFGDGVTDTAKNPSHIYTSYGSYTSHVIVSDPSGASGQATVAITVNAAGNGNETVILTIDPDAAYDIGAGAGAAMVTIADTTDLTTPTVAVVATDANAAEPNASVNSGTFTLNRTSRFHEDLAISYAIRGTASNGVDYSTLSGTLIIPKGVATKTLVITPKADAVADPNETVIVAIQANAAYLIKSGQGTAIVTIADTTVLTTPTVSLAVLDATAISPAPGVAVNTGLLLFKRTSRFQEPLVVNYTLSGTAVNGVDYTLLSGTATIPAGAASTVLRITPTWNVTKIKKNLVLTLATSGSYNIDGGNSTGIVTIVE